MAFSKLDSEFIEVLFNTYSDSDEDHVNLNQSSESHYHALNQIFAYFRITYWQSHFRNSRITATKLMQCRRHNRSVLTALVIRLFQMVLISLSCNVYMERSWSSYCHVSEYKLLSALPGSSDYLYLVCAPSIPGYLQSSATISTGGS